MIISTTNFTLTYFALKLTGDNQNDEHMVRAKTMILNHGGAAHCNVFTRITMALFGQVPWRATPFIPAEVIILPKCNGKECIEISLPFFGTPT